MTYQGNARHCGTCTHWAGIRNLSPSRQFVEVDPAHKGVCCGTPGNSHLPPTHTCGKWEKWAALR